MADPFSRCLRIGRATCVTRCLADDLRGSDTVSPIFQMSPATQQMQPTQTLQSPPPSGGRRRRVVDEDPDERRRKFLERNRAAATRCRQKRKVWVMSLEKKAEELTQTNMQLQVDTATQSGLGSPVRLGVFQRFCFSCVSERSDHAKE